MKCKDCGQNLWTGPTHLCPTCYALRVQMLEAYREGRVSKADFIAVQQQLSTPAGQAAMIRALGLDGYQI